MANIYFELTEAFNADGPTVALASGQAVVFYRIAIMSKDGDWVVRESADACARVRAVLESRGARYRPSPPLDVRWLSGGWSSHFEFFDDRHRRVRCDFVSRPPRVPIASTEACFNRQPLPPLLTVDVESLIAMKHTQRAKDYPIIGPLAALLPPERELLLTTDADRVLALAEEHGATVERPAVRAALSGDRRAVVVALATEADDLQQRDRRRVERYEAAAVRYLEVCRAMRIGELPLREAHAQMCAAAGQHLPPRVAGVSDADAE
jgi:hypothetical protein